MIRSKKADTAMMLILVAVAVGIGIFIFLNMSSNKSMITINLYDAAGNKIQNNAFSVVNGVPGVASMDLSVNVKNTGTAILNCTLGTLTPPAFNTAMVKTAKQIAVGATGTWQSGIISVAQFENLQQPVSFSVPVTCNFKVGAVVNTLPVQTGTIALTILPDAQGSFTVNVTSGAGGTVCGNSVCESGETQDSCPADCTVATRVIFRTLAGNYGSSDGGSPNWVALDGNGDNQLDCWVYSSTTGLTGTYLLTDMYGVKWAKYTGTPAGVLMVDFQNGRRFIAGSGCELSNSPVVGYEGKEKYS